MKKVTKVRRPVNLKRPHIALEIDQNGYFWVSWRSGGNVEAVRILADIKIGRWLERAGKYAQQERKK